MPHDGSMVNIDWVDIVDYVWLSDKSVPAISGIYPEPCPPTPLNTVDLSLVELYKYRFINICLVLFGKASIPCRFAASSIAEVVL